MGLINQKEIKKNEKGNRNMSKIENKYLYGRFNPNIKAFTQRL